MAPNTTRRALWPLRSTSLGWPRSDQADRSGGNSNKSVSSSSRTTLRGGKCPIRRRIRRFFPPQLGVRVEDVAGPLPHEPLPQQLPADGIVGGPPAGVAGQVVLEQGHGPLGGPVAQ